MRLQGKVAIVTGAASGMGAATARMFISEGARVMATDVLEAEGRALASALGPATRFERHDVSSEADWSRVVEATQNAFGRLDVLVNNAGISGSDPNRLSLSTFEQQVAINMRGVFLGMRAVIPIMQRAKSGSIVNISSISGVTGQDFVHMAYNGAKGAVRAMTKAAAVQFGKDGIRVNSVHPGLMPPMRTSRMSADPTVRERLLAAIPMGRTGRIEEVASANLFLASDEASYITGAELAVDGGYLAQ
ncbi:MAG TPA: glucose 1-dehydrogenase [Hyphomicrobiaceae bacterium]|nr:glucose 1-dehydrogenase [Hyphomicrobiaceae bacterium]